MPPFIAFVATKCTTSTSKYYTNALLLLVVIFLLLLAVILLPKSAVIPVAQKQLSDMNLGVAVDADAESGGVPFEVRCCLHS